MDLNISQKMNPVSLFFIACFNIAGQSNNMQQEQLPEGTLESFLLQVGWLGIQNVSSTSRKVLLLPPQFLQLCEVLKNPILQRSAVQKNSKQQSFRRWLYY